MNKNKLLLFSLIVVLVLGLCACQTKNKADDGNLNTEKNSVKAQDNEVVSTNQGKITENKSVESNHTETQTKVVEDIAAQPEAQNDSEQKTIDLRTIDDYKYIALTFDDGPIEGADEKILDLFTQYNGYTTFFVNGYRVEQYDQSLKKIVEQGSEIANHTYYHFNFRDLDEEQTLAEVENLNDLIQEKTGVKPAIIRPPFGEYKQLTLDVLPYPLVTWSQSSRDWEKQDKDFILENILNTSPGSIVLCHHTIPQTIEAIEEALPILYKQGYRFVTVSDLFKIYGVEPKPHQAYWYPQEEN